MKKWAIFPIFLLFFYIQTIHAKPLVFTSSEKQTTILELYTSEGCSSCPPADKWLSQLKNEQGLWHDFIPMAFHVDYWDYIGWKDRFASPQYTNRQKQYSQQQSLKTIYTPGFIYNGKEWRNWFGKRHLDLSQQTDMPGMLTISIEQQTLHYSYVPNNLSTNRMNF